MSEHNADRPTSETVRQVAHDLNEAWQIELATFTCEHCEWAYFVPAGTQVDKCPYCFRSPLVELTGHVPGSPHLRSPERMLPISVPQEILLRSIQKFASRIPFPPPDLKSDRLQARLQPLYLPMWLVDAEVQATWRAEVGFDYQVVSHQERYDQAHGGWTTQEVTETRIRWEPRVGRLHRLYENIPAPALEEHRKLMLKLGEFDLAEAVAYDPELVFQGAVRLANRIPKDAWPDALPEVQRLAMEECRVAADAEHLRDFKWNPEYPGRVWSQLLLPVYTSYYTDDEQNIQPVLIQGQTGKVSGPRRGSIKRAKQVSQIIALLAFAVVAFSLMTLAIPGLGALLSPLVVLGIILAIILGMGAIVPITVVWFFNRSQRRSD